MTIFVECIRYTESGCSQIMQGCNSKNTWSAHQFCESCWLTPTCTILMVTIRQSQPTMPNLYFEHANSGTGLSRARISRSYCSEEIEPEEIGGRTLSSFPAFYLRSDCEIWSTDVANYCNWPPVDNVCRVRNWIREHFEKLGSNTAAGLQTTSINYP